MIKKGFKKLFLILNTIIIIGYLIPNNVSSPIALNNIEKIDAESFWYYPWNEDGGVHKGIDIFCKPNTDVLALSSGIVISKGYGTISGNYIYILGAKWRTYYFAHMDTVTVSLFSFVKSGSVIGKTGSTGNAAGKPTHLHFSIETIFPYFWLYSKKDIEGWKKMFYLDPIKQLNFEKGKDAFLK